MENYINMLNAAYGTAILSYSGARKEQANMHHQSANAFLYLVIDERKNGVREPYHSRVISHLKSILKGGNEPCIDAVQIWSYPATVCALTLSKLTPSIWVELSADEIERCDHIMTAFAVMSNFISNDSNFYTTGFGLKGDVRKDRSPNFRFPFVTPAIAVAHYFGGADKLDEILTGFDYDAFIAKCKEYDFVNMLGVWETPSFEHNGEVRPGARDLITNGGEAYIVSNTAVDNGNVYRGGYGVGAKVPYIYNCLRADDIGVANSLIEYNHSGGEVKCFIGADGEDKYLCYTIDKSVSVMEGVDGMLLEYNLKDPGGIRSGGTYCTVDFMMEIALIMLLKETGAWAPDEGMTEKINAGCIDHIHKLSVGYMSQGMGMRYVEAENNLRGYYYAKDLYQRYIAEG